jgi:hypothetical protein
LPISPSILLTQLSGRLSEANVSSTRDAELAIATLLAQFSEQTPVPFGSHHHPQTIDVNPGKDSDPASMSHEDSEEEHLSECCGGLMDCRGLIEEDDTAP